MKIILSRKGFDSSNGGCPSPILPDGRLRSLPIPTCCSHATKYSAIYKDDKYPTGKIVKWLTQCPHCGKPSVKKNSYAHLDPDIDYDSIDRKKVVSREEWRGVFGQCDPAQGHLDGQNVSEGDLFLFFGLFRKTEQNNKKQDKKKLSFEEKSKQKHVIWGWLKVGEEPIDVEKGRIPKWCINHPHVSYKGEKWEKNTLYVASKNLEIEGLDKYTHLGGCGIFKTFKPELKLTASKQKINEIAKDIESADVKYKEKLNLWAKNENASLWCLPRWFKQKLSCHEKPKQKERWHDYNPKTDEVLLQSVPRGQEFVIDLDKLDSVQKEKAMTWLGEIFACAEK